MDTRHARHPAVGLLNRNKLNDYSPSPLAGINVLNGG
jgi:hypothetical protein